MSFAGVAPVLQTPFGDDEDEPVLHQPLAVLAERLVSLGADGLVVLGLASEASALTEAERDAVCATVVEAAGGRVPVIAGIEGATALAVERARQAVRLGASALMALPPRANGPDRLGDHFLRLADAAGVPVLIQDAPQVTGVELAPQLLLDVAARHPLLRAAKVEAPAAGAKIALLVAEGVEVVAGWGGLHYLESLRRGAVGCMPGSDLGPAFGAIHRLARDGREEAADDLYRTILPLLSYATQSLELLILCAKRALVRSGVFSSGSMRRPARELDAEEASSLDALFDRLADAAVPGWES
jgi:2-keto-3-deoxy-L-arabinonate dehydratase